MTTALRFVGGDAYLPGVPALDLSEVLLAELATLGIATREELIATGLYAPVSDNVPATPATDAPASAPTRARGKAKE